MSTELIPLPPTLSKSAMQMISSQIVSSSIEGGDVTDPGRAGGPLEKYIQLKFIASTVEQALKELKASAFASPTSCDHFPSEIRGVKIQKRRGAETLVYEADPVYKGILAALNERKALLDEAFHTPHSICDSEGEVIPKVPVKYGEDTMAIIFDK